MASLPSLCQNASSNSRSIFRMPRPARSIFRGRPSAPGSMVQEETESWRFSNSLIISAPSPDSVSLVPVGFAQGGLGDGDAEGGAAYVVEADRWQNSIELGSRQGFTGGN